jgi:hypothetical protein
MSAPFLSAATMRFLATEEARMAVQELSGRQISPADIRRLREQWGTDRATGIIEQHAISLAVLEKFGDSRLLGTRRAIQQASDTLTAAYKAARFPLGAVVVDWCCGMGGDLRSLALRGPVLGVDRDAAMCVAAAANAPGAVTVADDVLNQRPDSNAFLHVDPDRRPNERRVSRLELSSPPAEIVAAAARQAAGAAVKLSPAADIPESWRSSVHREWLSVRGECRQQVVWFGLAGLPGIHRAVRLNGRDPAAEFSGKPLAYSAEATQVGRFLFDLDPAVRAAGLSATFAETMNLQTVGGPGGYLTGDFPFENPLAATFEVLAVIPLDLRRLRQMVDAHHRDVHEIKVRGVETSPESLRKLTRIPGAPAATLLVGRTVQHTFAALAQRISPHSDAVAAGKAISLGEAGAPADP